MSQCFSHFNSFSNRCAKGPIGKGLLGRCKRFALYVDDGTVNYSVIAEDADFDPAGDDFPEKVLAPAILNAIKASK
jgi:hypothetical protein